MRLKPVNGILLTHHEDYRIIPTVLDKEEGD